MIVLGVSISDKGVKKYLPIPIFIGGLYLLYKIGLIGMYITNMEGDDAINIAGYTRYQYTFTVVMLYSALFFYFIYIRRKIFVRSSIRLTLLAIFAVTVICMHPIKTYVRPDYKRGGVHRRILFMIDEGIEGLDHGAKVLVYDGYPLIVLFVRFTFDDRECISTYDIKVVEEVLKKNENKYEYLLVSTKYEKIRELLKKYGYEEDVECICLLQ